MPGFDGTGPRSEGPMTGGGRGRCNPRGRGIPQQGGGFYGVGRGGIPCGGGRGRTFGGGRGWAMRYSAVNLSSISKVEEKNILAEQIVSLEQELRAIRARLDEIASE